MMVSRYESKSMYFPPFYHYNNRFSKAIQEDGLNDHKRETLSVDTG